MSLPVKSKKKSKYYDIIKDKTGQKLPQSTQNTQQSTKENAPKPKNDTIDIQKDSKGNVSGINYKGTQLTPQEYEQFVESKKTGASDIGVGATNLSPNLMAVMQQQNESVMARRQLSKEAELQALEAWEIKTGRNKEAMTDAEKAQVLAQITAPIEQQGLPEKGGILGLNPLEAAQAGSKFLASTIAGAGAGAGVGAGIGAAFGGVGALPGAIAGGVIGGIGGMVTGSAFVISQIKENERQDVRVARTNFNTAEQNINNIINQANQGKASNEVIRDFRIQEQTIRQQLAILKDKSKTQIGEDLAKSLDDQAIMQGFLDFELQHKQMELLAAIASPNPNKIIYNSQSEDTGDLNE